MTAINGVAINSRPEMQEQLSRYRPGHRILVTFVRRGRSRDLAILLRDKANRPGQLVSDRSDDQLHLLGFELRDLGADELLQFPAGGVRVVSIFRHSPIAATQMATGFTITSLNGEPVGDLSALLRRLPSEEGTLLFGGRYPGHGEEYYYQPD